MVPATLATASSAAPEADKGSGLMQPNIEVQATTIPVAVDTEAVNAALTWIPVPVTLSEFALSLPRPLPTQMIEQ